MFHMSRVVVLAALALVGCADAISKAAAVAAPVKGLAPNVNATAAAAAAASQSLAEKDRFARAGRAVRESGRLAGDNAALVAYEAEVAKDTVDDEAVAAKWMHLRLELARGSTPSNATKSGILRPLRKGAAKLTGKHGFFKKQATPAAKKLSRREVMMLEMEAAAYNDAGKLSNASLAAFTEVLCLETGLNLTEFTAAFAEFETDFEAEMTVESDRRIEALMEALTRPDFAKAAYASLVERKSKLLENIKSAANLEVTRKEMLKLINEAKKGDADGSTRLRAAQTCAQLTQAVESLLGRPLTAPYKPPL